MASLFLGVNPHLQRISKMHRKVFPKTGIAIPLIQVTESLQHSPNGLHWTALKGIQGNMSETDDQHALGKLRN